MIRRANEHAPTSRADAAGGPGSEPAGQPRAGHRAGTAPAAATCWWDWLSRASIAYLLACGRGVSAGAQGQRLRPVQPEGWAGLPDAAPAAHPPSSGQRRLMASRRGSGAQRPPRHELVLSRPAHEQIGWIFKVPPFWSVTVYTNHTPHEVPFWPVNLEPQMPWRWRTLAHDSFGQAFAHHLQDRYGSLADYTVFSPAFPLEQSPSLLDMMFHPALLARVQAMSLRVNERLPPKHIVDGDRPDVWYRAQKFSLRTLEPVDFLDADVRWATQSYRNLAAVGPEVNVVRHFLLELGVEQDWLSEDTELGSFAYGGIIGFTRQAARRHPQEIYARLEEKAALLGAYSLLIERTWLMLLAGDAYHEARPDIAWRRVRPALFGGENDSGQDRQHDGARRS